MVFCQTHARFFHIVFKLTLTNSAALAGHDWDTATMLCSFILHQSIFPRCEICIAWWSASAKHWTSFQNAGVM